MQTSSNADPRKSERIVVVGSGLMGRGIGQAFAAGGYKVKLVDINRQILEDAIDQTRAFLQEMSEEGFLGEPIDVILDRISIQPDLNKAVADATFVVEAVFEDLELKKDVFRRLSSSASPSCILTSNTTSIRISTLASVSKNPERVIGTHFWNPAQLMRAVEVVMGDKTSQKTVEKTVSILESIGKRPAVVKKDVPGQIGIRILYAMIREATWLVENGVASPKDIDTAVKEALGTRLEVVGPLELADLSGVDLVNSVAKTLYSSLDSSNEPQKIIQDMVEKGDLGIKSGKGFYDWKKDRDPERTLRERDEHLIEILKRSKG